MTGIVPTTATRGAALVAAGALVLAGCGPVEPTLSVDNHTGALDAIADSFSGSFRWEGRVDVHIDDEDVASLREADDLFATADVGWLEDLATAYVHGALGDDGSWQAAFVDGDTEWLDIRLGVGELLDASTLEPDVAVYLRLDLPYIIREWAFGYLTLDVLRDEASAELGGTPLGDVVLAIIDGGWGGLAGVIDLASFGVTEHDLAEARDAFREEFIGVADRATLLELLDAAVTLRSFASDGAGGSVAILDVHPHAAAMAIYDLFDDAEALAVGPGEELPETLEAVATVTFDEDGLVTSVITDVLAIARQVADFQSSLGDEPWRQEGAELLRNMTRSTLAVEFRFSDHGQVATVLDVDDPVTATWGELGEFFAGLYRPYTEGITDAEPYELEEVPLDDIDDIDDLGRSDQRDPPDETDGVPGTAPDDPTTSGGPAVSDEPGGSDGPATANRPSNAGDGSIGDDAAGQPSDP